MGFLLCCSKKEQFVIVYWICLFLCNTKQHSSGHSSSLSHKSTEKAVRVFMFHGEAVFMWKMMAPDFGCGPGASSMRLTHQYVSAWPHTCTPTTQSNINSPCVCHSDFLVWRVCWKWFSIGCNCTRFRAESWELVKGTDCMFTSIFSAEDASLTGA